MATLTERLAFIMTLDANQAVKGFQNVGKAADKGLDQAESRLDKMGGTFTKVGAGMLAFSGVAGAGLFKLAQGASDLGESISAATIIFGEGAGTIEQFGESAASSFGLSKRAAVDAANTFGTFGKSAGLAGEDLAGFSTEMVGLAGDLASFKNTSPEQAIEAIGAALRGESEPIRAYGVLLDDATLKARAMELGIYNGTGALTTQQKVMAAQAEILAQTSDAQGDYARTSDSLANQQRTLAANIQNLKDSIGAGLVPMFSTLVGGASKAAEAFAGLDAGTQATVGKIAGFGVAAAGIVGTFSVIAGQAIKMRDRFTELGTDGERSLTKLGKAASGVGIAFGVMATAMAAVEIFDNLTKDSDAAGRSMQEFLATVGDGSQNAGDRLYELGQVADKTFKNSSSWAQAGSIIGSGLNEAEVNARALTDAFKGVLAQSPQVAQQVIDDMLTLSDAVNDGNQEAQEYAEYWGINADVVRDWQSRVDAATGSQETLTSAATEGTEATEGATEATIDSAAAAEELKDAQDAERDAVEAAAEALRDQADALNEQIDGMRSSADATIDAKDSQDKFVRAAQQTVEVMGDTEATAEDVADAVNSERDAMIQAAQAAEGLAGKHGGATAKLDAFNSSLLSNAQFATPAAKRAITDYIIEANGIPESESTEIRAAIDSGDFATAERLLSSNGGLSRARTAAVKADADTAAAERELGPQGLTRDRNVRIIANQVAQGARAGGGIVQPGEAVTLVGEQGPELVSLPAGSRVHTAPETRGLMSGAGGGIGGGGVAAGSGGVTNVTVVMPPGVDGREVLRALKRRERYNGPGWRS